MKMLDKLTRRFTKSASVAVKAEMTKTAIDLIPLAAGIASTIAGFIIFKDATVDVPEIKPAVTNTSITTNNYFFQQLSDDAIRQILEEKK